MYALIARKAAAVVMAAILLTGLVVIGSVEKAKLKEI